MEYRLKEIGTVITGGTPKTKNAEYYLKKDYLFIGPTDIKDCKYVRKSEKYISNEAYKDYKKKFISKNSIMVDCIGSDMGNVAISVNDVLTNQQINSITNIDEKRFNVEYIYYILSTMKKYFHQIGTNGSTMPIINKTMFEDIVIDIPNKKTQDVIANILSKLDQKIELNNNINDNLSKLAKEIYNDFYSQNDGKIYKLEDLVKFSQGKQIGVEQQYLEMKEGLKRFLRIVDFTNPKEPKRYVEDYGDRYWANYEEIIIVRYGSQTCGDVVRGKKGIIANNMFKVIPNNKNLNNYLFYYLSSDKIQNYIKGAQNSSTMPSINFGLLNKLEIKVILEKKINEFNNIIEPIRKKKIEIELQNETLEQLRDTLLPKLMSDEINLDSIEV